MAMSGRVIYIAPDYPSPSGGMRAIYRHVELLCAAGERAVVWHRDPGFRCEWFKHDAAIVGGDTLPVEAADLLVVPEVLIFPGFDPAPRARKAIFNQGYFHTYDHWDDPAGYPGWEPLPVLWTTSAASAAVLSRVNSALDLHRVPVSIDTELFRPVASRARRITWMPRRHGGEARLLEMLLRADDRLAEVELVALDGVDEQTVADVLGSTSVFLALGEREGFGRPPAEAMAAGCLVVGYPAGGGVELFEAPGAFAVADGDVLTLAEKAAMLVLEERDTGDQDTGELRRRTREWVASRYGVDRERDALLQAVAAARRRPAGEAATATHPAVHAEALTAPAASTTAATDELARLRAELAVVREQAAQDVRELAAQLDAATGELASTRRRAAALADEVRDRRAEQAGWQSAVERLVTFEETSALLAEYTRDTARLNDRLDDTIRQKMALEARVADLEASTSWRVTAPLRVITGTLKGERRG
jgi:Glycosyl transferases group 1